MAVGGTLRLCLISPNSTGLSASIPLTSAGSGVGLGGAPISGTISTVVSSAPVFARFSIHGAPWTIRTRWVPFVGTSNSGIYTISSAGYAETPLGSPLTLSTVGTLHMVSPVRVGTSLSPIEHGGFVTLTVKYVPEPTLGVLLASGAAVLGLLGRRRRR